MRASAFITLLISCATAWSAEPVFRYETVRVAEGIHAFIEPPARGIVSGNSIVIAGDDGALVIDTGQHPSLTKKMIAEIRTLTNQPVRYVVNTHWHNDHVTGNAAYAEAFPGVTIIAHPFTAELMAREIPRYTGERCRTTLTTQMQPYRQGLVNGKTPDGREVTPERRKAIERLLQETDAAFLECDEYRHVAPNLLVDKSITIRLGKREVRLMYLGRANTAGDLVAYVPDVKVLVTGDILVHPFPYATQSYIAEWATVLRELEKMDAAIIVPGHGAVQRDKRYLANIAGLMESIRDQVKAAYRPGVPFEDVRKAVNLDEWRVRIAGDDPQLNAAFRGGMISSAINRAWQEAKGEMAPEGSPPD